MAAEKSRFQILALSGGGYRGLFTARILAEIERQIDAPIGSRFDLVTGTSIGGILALAVALELPAQKIVELFEGHGEAIFRRRFSIRGFFRSQYSSQTLLQHLSSDNVFGQRLLGECLHPVIVPSINYTRGLPVVFKTPHHEDFKTDHRHRIVDVAMATSAAPIVFPAMCSTTASTWMADSLPTLRGSWASTKRTSSLACPGRRATSGCSLLARCLPSSRSTPNGTAPVERLTGVVGGRSMRRNDFSA